MQACVVEPLDEARAKEIGLLLTRTKTRTRPDIVDATVVVGAVRRGDAIVTSDPDDIGRLIAAARATVRVLRV